MELSHAKGSYLWVVGDETPYLDMIMGFGSTNFGHANPRIIQFVQEAAQRIDNTTPFGYAPRNQLSQSLVAQLPFNAIDYQVHYTIGGAKCVESALEVARVASGKDGVVSFKGSFHGYATSVIGISDTIFFSEAHAKFKQGGIININFPGTEEEVEDSMMALRRTLEGADVGTVIIEAAQGLAGFRIAPLRFFSELQRVVTEYGLILIVDDILLGMGRVGAMYSFAGLGLNPDMVLLGKSLAGGYYPLSAIIARQRLFDLGGVSCTGLDSTFSNNPFGIYIANEIQKMLVEDRIFEQSGPVAKAFNDLMHKLLEDFKSHVVSMFVMGFAGSIRLQNHEIAKSIMQHCLDKHVFVQLAGVNQDHIRMTPSLLMSVEEVHKAQAVLVEAFSSVLNAA